MTKKIHVPIVATSQNVAWTWEARRRGAIRSTFSVVRLSSGAAGVSLISESSEGYTAEHARLTDLELIAIRDRIDMFLRGDPQASFGPSFE